MERKYKLIKKYPGSFELGTIVKRNEFDNKSCYKYYTEKFSNPITKYEVENQPEYWEEITIAKCAHCGKEIIVQEYKDCSCIEKIWVKRRKLNEPYIRSLYRTSWLINKKDLGKDETITSYAHILLENSKLVEEKCDVWGEHLVQCTEYEAYNWFKKKSFTMEDGKKLYVGDDYWICAINDVKEIYKHTLTETHNQEQAKKVDGYGFQQKY